MDTLIPPSVLANLAKATELVKCTHELNKTREQAMKEIGKLVQEILSLAEAYQERQVEIVAALREIHASPIESIREKVGDLLDSMTDQKQSLH